MEKGKYPECGNAIGGMNHKLDESNQLAKEFDGADHASFSDKASENQNIDYEDTFAVWQQFFYQNLKSIGFHDSASKEKSNKKNKLNGTLIFFIIYKSEKS